MGTPSCLYLLTSISLGVCKIGISNVESLQKRLNEHKNQGFKIVENIWNFATGLDAYKIEQRIITWWRDELGIPPALTRREMPRHGYSETAFTTLIPVEYTMAKIEEFKTSINPQNHQIR